MPRIIRENPGRDENLSPQASDCIAHRCAAHAELPPVDDSADDGGECGPCVGEKYIAAYERAAEEDIKKNLLWPSIDSARDRLNLLAKGAGDQFVEEVRARVQAYDRAPVETVVETT